MTREWTSRPPGTRAVRVDLAEKVHAKLRILAAEAGVAMSVFVRGLAEKAVRERFPEVFEEASPAAASPSADAAQPEPPAGSTRSEGESKPVAKKGKRRK